MQYLSFLVDINYKKSYNRGATIKFQRGKIYVIKKMWGIAAGNGYS